MPTYIDIIIPQIYSFYNMDKYNVIEVYALPLASNKRYLSFKSTAVLLGWKWYAVRMWRHRLPTFLTPATRFSSSCLEKGTRALWTCFLLPPSNCSTAKLLLSSKNVLQLLLMLCTRNNTDVNKLMIISGIALYYGDTYYNTHLCVVWRG